MKTQQDQQTLNLYMRLKQKKVIWTHRRETPVTAEQAQPANDTETKETDSDKEEDNHVAEKDEINKVMTGKQSPKILLKLIQFSKHLRMFILWKKLLHSWMSQMRKNH